MPARSMLTGMAPTVIGGNPFFQKPEKTIDLFPAK
jgi:hypothetical protein